MPRVAVNLVTWNSWVCVNVNLNAVFAQTGRDLAVTVVDNGSTDGTVKVLKGWAERGVRLIENSSNVGYAKAHNQAIAATDSEFVLTLNPDALLTPRFIEHIVAAMDSEPTAGSASGKLLRISAEQLAGEPSRLDQWDEARIDSAGLLMRRSRRQFLRCYLEHDTGWHDQPAWVFGPDGAAAFYRRTMLEDAAYKGEVFDETFVTHKEDVDLAWRAQLLGWDSLYVPEAVAYHVRGFRPGERTAIEPGIRRDAVKNRWLMMAKNEIPGLALRDLPFIASYELGILGYLLLRERSSLAAIPEFLRLLPEVLARRKELHRRRKRGSRQMSRWFADSPDVAFPLIETLPARAP